MSSDVTVLIITFNEAPNIGRCLERLTWASRVLVLDSFSPDETVSIALRFPNVEVLSRKFESFADQCNFGLSHITTAWVLSIDCDYMLSESFFQEALSLVKSGYQAGWHARFRYCIHGRPLRSTLYPTRCVLYRREAAFYENEGHGHRIRISGSVGLMESMIDHDDRKPLSRWFSSQLRYAEVEAAHLMASESSLLPVQDRLRKMIVLAPPLTLIYCLLYKGLVLDGWRGWYYTWQRVLAEIILALCLLELKFGKVPER